MAAQQVSKNVALTIPAGSSCEPTQPRRGALMAGREESGSATAGSRWGTFTRRSYREQGVFQNNSRREVVEHSQRDLTVGFGASSSATGDGSRGQSQRDLTVGTTCYSSTGFRGWCLIIRNHNGSCDPTKPHGRDSSAAGYKVWVCDSRRMLGRRAGGDEELGVRGLAVRG